MKVLLVHNDYGKHSGEESVLAKMSKIYDGLGFDVAELRKTTAGIRDSVSGKIKVFLNGLYSPSGIRSMKDAIVSESPDIVHVHNLYPFITPAALCECSKRGIPVVMTVHNFRLICPTGLFMKSGIPCERCLETHNEWPCIIGNCEGSIMKSFAYSARNAIARIKGYYDNNVDCYACITSFQKRKLIEWGIPEDKIVVIPNSIDIKETATDYKFGDYVAYVGRLSYEKGYDLLIDVARRNPDIKFKIAGAYRDSNIGKVPSNVELTGYLHDADLEDMYKNARFIVMPSRCYEGFPMTILEAAKYGKIVLGPEHGAFSEIIGKGEESIGGLFKPSDLLSLEEQIRDLWNNEPLVRSLGENARKVITRKYSDEIVSKQWHKLVIEILNKK